MEARSLFHPGKQSPKNMVSPVRQAAILLLSNQFYQGPFKSVTCFSQVDSHLKCILQSIHITSLFSQVDSYVKCNSP
jgi:hypothetical protein